MSTPRKDRAEDGHRLLVQLRESRGWGRGRLALEFELVGRRLGLPVPDRKSMEKAIYRHEKGVSQVGRDGMYVTLYTTVYELSMHELFGGMPKVEPNRDLFALDSHKFMPAYVGPVLVDKLGQQLGGEVVDTGWATCWRASVEHPRGECSLYGFPWGSLVYHLVEERAESHVADLAIWRHHSYPRELDWARDSITNLLPDATGHPEYVLSAFWLTSPKWDGPELETAMRLLCTPRTLIGRDVDDHASERARLLERTLLTDGYDNQGIVDFGTRGVSLGFASWAGVSYHPFAAREALDVSHLINLQVLVQGLWCFCRSLRTEIEAGRDPEVVDAYGWRWLRGIRSRLTNAHPKELTQASSMRVAILQTSELEGHLTSAVEILRDAEREGIR